MSVHPRTFATEPNNDEKVDSSDLMIMSNMVAGKSNKTDAADLNSDGQVNIVDLVMMINIIVGK